MPASVMKYRQIRQGTTLEMLPKLASEMATKGHRTLKVNFSSCPQLYSKQLSWVDQFEDLIALSIFTGGLGHRPVEVPKIPTLKCLQLSGLKLGATLDLQEMNRLNQLHIQFCKFENVVPPPSLRSVNLMQCDIKSAEWLANCPELEWLKLKNCCELASIPELKSASSLKRVTLENAPSLTSISGVLAAESLQDLRMDYCPRVPDEDFTLAAQHPRLERIFPGRTADAFAKLASRFSPDQVLKSYFEDDVYRLRLDDKLIVELR